MKKWPRGRQRLLLHAGFLLGMQSGIKLAIMHYVLSRKRWTNSYLLPLWTLVRVKHHLVGG
jgi:hypothetical protein